MEIHRITRLWGRSTARAVALWAIATAFVALAERPPAIADLLADGATSYAAGDYGGAALAWRSLAGRGDPMAQFNMGLLHETGRGVAAEPSAAAAWYERAARQGVAAAQYNLAVLYQAGRGVPEDAGRALYWLEVAARHAEGVPRIRAVEAAAQLAPLLSEESATAARAEARAFSAREEAWAMPERGRFNLVLSPGQIEDLQRRLAVHGYDSGPLDGVAGEQTRRAVRRYLEDRGIIWPPGKHLTQGLLDLVKGP